MEFNVRAAQIPGIWSTILIGCRKHLNIQYLYLQFIKIRKYEPPPPPFSDFLFTNLRFSRSLPPYHCSMGSDRYIYLLSSALPVFWNPISERVPWIQQSLSLGEARRSI